MSYSKLFSSILASTIWNEDNATRIVWITMLAMKDRDGIVEASVPGLAVLARVSPSECEKAIAVLSAPDPDSRTQTHDGRRIEKCDGGWFIINHDLYQMKGSADEQKEKTRIRVERYRQRQRCGVTVGNAVKREETQVTPLGLGLGLGSLSSSGSLSSAVPEGATAPRAARIPDASKPDDVSPEVWADWVAHRKRKRASITDRVLSKTRIDAKAAGMTLEAALTHWVAQGYAGFFPPQGGTQAVPRVTTDRNGRLSVPHSGFDKMDHGKTGAI